MSLELKDDYHKHVGDESGNDPIENDIDSDNDIDNDIDNYKIPLKPVSFAEFKVEDLPNRKEKEKEQVKQIDKPNHSKKPSSDAKRFFQKKE